MIWIGVIIRYNPSSHHWKYVLFSLFYILWLCRWVTTGTIPPCRFLKIESNLASDLCPIHFPSSSNMFFFPWIFSILADHPLSQQVKNWRGRRYSLTKHLHDIYTSMTYTHCHSIYRQCTTHVGKNKKLKTAIFIKRQETSCSDFIPSQILIAEVKYYQ